MGKTISQLAGYSKPSFMPSRSKPRGFTTGGGGGGGTTQPTQTNLEGQKRSTKEGVEVYRGGVWVLEKPIVKEEPKPVAKEPESLKKPEDKATTTLKKYFGTARAEREAENVRISTSDPEARYAEQFAIANIYGTTYGKQATALERGQTSYNQLIEKYEGEGKVKRENGQIMVQDELTYTDLLRRSRGLQTASAISGEFYSSKLEPVYSNIEVLAPQVLQARIGRIGESIEPTETTRQVPIAGSRIDPITGLRVVDRTNITGYRDITKGEEIIGGVLEAPSKAISSLFKVQDIGTYPIYRQPGMETTQREGIKLEPKKDIIGYYTVTPFEYKLTRGLAIGGQVALVGASISSPPLFTGLLSVQTSSLAGRAIGGKVSESQFLGLKGESAFITEASLTAGAWLAPTAIKDISRSKTFERIINKKTTLEFNEATVRKTFTSPEGNMSRYDYLGTATQKTSYKLFGKTFTSTKSISYGGEFVVVKGQRLGALELSYGGKNYVAPVKEYLGVGLSKEPFIVAGEIIPSRSLGVTRATAIKAGWREISFTYGGKEITNLNKAFIRTETPFTINIEQFPEGSTRIFKTFGFSGTDTLTPYTMNVRYISGKLSESINLGGGVATRTVTGGGSIAVATASEKIIQGVSKISQSFPSTISSPAFFRASSITSTAEKSIQSPKLAPIVYTRQFSDTFSKQAPLIRLDLGSGQGSKTRLGLGSASIPSLESSQEQIVGLVPIQEQIPKLKTPQQQRPITPQIPKYGFPRYPPFIPSLPSLPKIPNLGKSRGLFQFGKGIRTYQPSFIALPGVIFQKGIFGSMPKRITGFGLRPIPITKSTRRKKKRK